MSYLIHCAIQFSSSRFLFLLQGSQPGRKQSLLSSFGNQRQICRSQLHALGLDWANHRHPTNNHQWSQLHSPAGRRWVSSSTSSQHGQFRLLCLTFKHFSPQCNGVHGIVNGLQQFKDMTGTSRGSPSNAERFCW